MKATIKIAGVLALAFFFAQCAYSPKEDTSSANAAAADTQTSSAAVQQAQPAASAGNWVGKAAPDLSMPTPKGDTISISSFKGKYLLVDFWASWCGPCRGENPNVVRAYNKYKSKNFTVLSVSLDQNKDAWMKAIKEDKLTWSHMSDLAFWNSKAVETYHFDGIPYNVLIDPNGIIIGEALRGFDLEKKLAEVLK